MLAQKRLAARVLKCGVSRVWIDPKHVEDVRNAITAADIRRLVKRGVIKKLPEKGTSRARARKIAEQKKKGRRKGIGSRKGAKYARKPKKERWMERIRAQRKLLRELRDKGKITRRVYRELYRKASGGFFHSKAHLLLYINRNNLWSEEYAKKKA